MMMNSQLLDPFGEKHKQKYKSLIPKDWFNTFVLKILKESKNCLRQN